MVLRDPYEWKSAVGLACTLFVASLALAPALAVDHKKFAAEINTSVENIGARRLHTVMERLLEEISFTASDNDGRTVTIDAAYVREQVGGLAKDSDLSKFIL